MNSIEWFVFKDFEFRLLAAHNPSADSIPVDLLCPSHFASSAFNYPNNTSIGVSKYQYHEQKEAVDGSSSGQSESDLFLSVASKSISSLILFINSIFRV
jgi:hypothetical protein